MKEQLSYLKSVIEGADDIEPWSVWFERNAAVLEKHLTRRLFLRLKLLRSEAIGEVLELYDIKLNPSDRYDWLAGKPGRCRDCGMDVVQQGAFTWCPNGCFRLHSLRRRTLDT